MRETQLFAAFHLRQGRLGPGQISLDEPGKARKAYIPANGSLGANQAPSISGDPVIEIGRGLFQRGPSGMEVAPETASAPHAHRWPPVPLRHVRELHPQRLRQLRGPAQIATGGVVDPQRIQGRVQLRRRIVADQLQAPFELGGCLRAGVTLRRRREEAGLQASGDLLPVARRTRGDPLNVLQCPVEVDARFVERAAPPRILLTPPGGPLRPRRNARLVRNGVQPTAIRGPRRPMRRRGRLRFGCAVDGGRWAVRAPPRPRARVRGGNANCLCRSAANTRTRVSSLSSSSISRLVQVDHRGQQATIEAAADQRGRLDNGSVFVLGPQPREKRFVEGVGHLRGLAGIEGCSLSLATTSSM